MFTKPIKETSQRVVIRGQNPVSNDASSCLPASQVWEAWFQLAPFEQGSMGVRSTHGVNQGLAPLAALSTLQRHPPPLARASVALLRLALGGCGCSP